MGQIERKTPIVCWLGLAGMLFATPALAQHVSYQAGPRYQASAVPVQAVNQAVNPQGVAVNQRPPNRVVPIGVANTTANGGAAWGTAATGSAYANVAPQGATTQRVVLASAEQPVSPAPDLMPVQQSSAAGSQPGAGAPTPAWLQGTTAPGQPAPPESFDFTAILRRLVIGTFGVLIACVASLWAARQWLTKTRTVVDNRGRIRVLDVAALANRGSVQLIEVDGQKLLLGFDTGGLKTMLPVTEPFTSALGELDKR